MTDRLPEPHEGEWIDAEIVDSDIWNSCTRHHMRHCLACFPHQPWKTPKQEAAEYLVGILNAGLADLINAAQDATLRDFANIQNDHLRAMRDINNNYYRRRAQILRRFKKWWGFLITLYALCAVFEWVAGSITWTVSFIVFMAYSIFMVCWNERRARQWESKVSYG